MTYCLSWSKYWLYIFYWLIFSGVNARRTTGLWTNNPLKNARQVSVTVTRTEVLLNPDISAHVMQWGQFIAHEFTQLRESDRKWYISDLSFTFPDKNHTLQCPVCTKLMRNHLPWCGKGWWKNSNQKLISVVLFRETHVI